MRAIGHGEQQLAVVHAAILQAVSAVLLTGEVELNANLFLAMDEIGLGRLRAAAKALPGFNSRRDGRRTAGASHRPRNREARGMLARTPFTEIEGVGTYRLPNQWQAHRLRRLRGDGRQTAVLAVGCGMTVRQFSKLPAGLQAEVHKAYLALMSPSNLAPLADPAPADTRAIPRGHLLMD